MTPWVTTTRLEELPVRTILDFPDEAKWLSGYVLTEDEFFVLKWTQEILDQ